MCFCLLLKAGGHAKAGRLPEGYIEFVFFGRFLVVQPAFGCAQHPKAGKNTQHKNKSVKKFYPDVLSKKFLIQNVRDLFYFLL